MTRARSGLRFAYLSGSPRIATRDDAELSGPRAHILGFLDGLRAEGHTVRPFVLGDRVSPRISGTGSQRVVSGGLPRQLAVDAVRLALRPRVARQARRALPEAFDVAYERFALFQELGARFRSPGTAWVVETNAVMSQEARHERNALALHRTAARLERRTYARADLVVAVSERLRDALVADAGVDPRKTLVVPNGVDVERFAAQPARPQDGQLVIGFVGFVIARQGLDELVDAVEDARRRGAPVRAEVVGDGPDRARLEAGVRGRGLADVVRFSGQVPWSQVPGRIAAFDVGYSGQRGVGGMSMYHSPLKIYEYLASARPVVAARHPDAEQALVASRAGWLFPPGDAGALADVLIELCALPADQRAAAGARGRRLVQEEHTWPARVRQVTQALAERGLVA